MRLVTLAARGAGPSGEEMRPAGPAVALAERPVGESALPARPAGESALLALPARPVGESVLPGEAVLRLVAELARATAGEGRPPAVPGGLSVPRPELVGLSVRALEEEPQAGLGGVVPAGLRAAADAAAAAAWRWPSVATRGMAPGLGRLAAESARSRLELPELRPPCEPRLPRSEEAAGAACRAAARLRRGAGGGGVGSAPGRARGGPLAAGP